MEELSGYQQTLVLTAFTHDPAVDDGPDPGYDPAIGQTLKASIGNMSRLLNMAFKIVIGSQEVKPSRLACGMWRAAASNSARLLS
ncbi:hypothetical protein [Rhizobium leguminosarum]|uniref:hypothetical protein n=1 Tax=Rhizobium leguminosarum TaxID=384 RepID=UPI001C939BF4|nr:hypothetical protein [Rhizobium leguminosarum]MBY5529397.1 hypothetical protein [Rhizobium leguminosarum]